MLESGLRWEEQVVGMTLAARAVVAPGTGLLRDRRFTPAETLLLTFSLPTGVTAQVSRAGRPIPLPRR